eukprot:1092434-Prymnesium_polylepis.1
MSGSSKKSSISGSSEMGPAGSAGSGASGSGFSLKRDIPWSAAARGGGAAAEGRHRFATALLASHNSLMRNGLIPWAYSLANNFGQERERGIRLATPCARVRATPAELTAASARSCCAAAAAAAGREEEERLGRGRRLLRLHAYVLETRTGSYILGR